MLDVIFRGRCPIQEAILKYLSATEVSMLVAALRCRLAKEDRERFQTPIRDLNEYQDWIEEMRKSGHGVRLIGKDVVPLLDRILQPERYLRRYERNAELTIWLAILPRKRGSDTQFRSAFKPILGEHPKVPLVHSSQYATDEYGISWFDGPRENDQSIKVIQYLTNHIAVGEQEVRLVPRPESFRYVFDFHEYSTVMWPGLITGVWKSGQCPKTEPLYSVHYLDLEEPFQVKTATSSETQNRDMLNETYQGEIRMKFETPYMEEYNIMRRTPQISIKL